MRCKGTTRRGYRCGKSAILHTGYCAVHAPEGEHGKQAQSDLVFSRALYYPYIEIRDEGWLKNAALYWDSISTIVPAGFPPYRSETCTELRAAEILLPLEISSKSAEVLAIEDQALQFFYSAEAQAVLRPQTRPGSREEEMSYIHPEKMAYGLGQKLLTYGTRRDRSATWHRVPERFAAFYMTLLASNLARERGRALLTDNGNVALLASSAMLGSTVSPYSHRAPAQIAEGMLSTLTLRTVRVDPETPVRQIIKFREDHYAEIGRFRKSIRGLTEGLKGTVSSEALASHVATIHSDEVVPTLEELRSKLRENRIRCGFNNIKMSTLASVSPTVLGATLAGTLAGPFALVAGVALSVVLATAHYQSERRELLRSSPFSYVLAAEKAFRRRSS